MQKLANKNSYRHDNLCLDMLEHKHSAHLKSASYKWISHFPYIFSLHALMLNDRGLSPRE